MATSKDGLVECPICHLNVPEKTINKHIDANCQCFSASTGTSSDAATSGSLRMAPLFNKKAQHSAPPTTAALKPSVAKRVPMDASKPVETAKRAKHDAKQESMPLAAKVRPMTLAEFVGQEELLGADGVLRTLIECDRIPSMVLWGPPGCGKTTIARIISKMTKSRFIELSATSHGAADVKKAFEEAKGHLSLTGQRTIVFIDEIHRFTKAQQDLFLPFVEQGTIHLIGATTENPSFKVNSALLSRCRVFILQRLNEDQLAEILRRALNRWRVGNTATEESPDENAMQVDATRPNSEELAALKLLATFSDGDARNALNTLEIAINTLPSIHHPLHTDTIKGAFQKSHLLYDRNGEEHYNVISALHKSIRGSDPDAALYWLGRMLEAGEDPLYIARRLVRCASEDIGLADNTALTLAISAYNACERIGMPECDTILAHLVVHLAETKKSIRSYKAYNLVKATIRQEPNYPVPLHIRNAPTKLMKDVGYGAGYKYNPEYQEPVEQTYLPDALIGRKFLDIDK